MARILDRRTFLRLASGAVALGASGPGARAQGANDRLVVGVMGTSRSNSGRNPGRGRSWATRKHGPTGAANTDPAGSRRSDGEVARYFRIFPLPPQDGHVFFPWQEGQRGRVAPPSQRMQGPPRTHRPPTISTV